MRNRRTKQILLWVAIALAVLAVTYCVLRFAFSVDVLDQSGWNTGKGYARYLDYWGRARTGWQEIEGNTYYFAPENGAMATGWHEIDGAKYYFREDGTRADRWLEVDGKRYYLGEDGALTTGWLQLENKKYYFAAEDGAMAVGWLELDGSRMYFAGDGSLQTGWQTLDGKLYYLTPEGTTVSGWVELDGIRYRFAEDGSAAVGWYEDDSGRYFFGEDGKPQTGWLDWEQKRYFLKEDGSVTTGWMEDGDDRYYFLPSGRMAIGEVEVDGVSRFFTSKGKEVLMCNPWHPIPADFETDMVEIEGKLIDRKAKEPLEQMLAAGRAEGIVIGINNSYRSVENQRSSWNASVALLMEEGLSKEQAEKHVGTVLAIPGHSEHHTGLALDVNSGYRVYEWLGEHCWEYGFILRYPDDKTSITGIKYEAWHFRYVGTELSLELKELGLCMEEYMTELTEQQKRIED